MKLLAYIGTFNETIERPLQGLLAQTRPVDEILVVDNASTRDVPQGPFSKKVTVVHNSVNLGPGGAIGTGLQYGLVHGYDWMWVFDADSAPREDALEKLIELYNRLDPAMQRQTGVLSCSNVLLPSNRLFQGRRFIAGGPRKAKVGSDDYYECDAVIWSGSLYRLAAVREVGMPRCGVAGFWEDLGHDYGDMEFSNRIRRAGYRILVHRTSLVDQTVGRSKATSLFGVSILSTNHPPFRRFLYFRNMVFFWLQLYPRRNWVMLSLWFGYRFSTTLLKIMVMEEDRVAKMAACFRGARDGLLKRMTGRY
jgi:rhamnosyltransferase